YPGSHPNVGVLALDAPTGRLRWFEALGWGQQELNLFGEPVKELAAAAPAVQDGVVYATSGLGFLAALAVRTGRPLWLASYEIQTIQPVQYWFRAPLRFPLVSPSPLIVAGDLVLAAPTDARYLHAFDRRTGALRWRVPYPPLPLLGTPDHLLGVAFDGRRDVVLMTGRDLEAYELTSGRRVWLGRLQDDADEPSIPVGQGVIAGDTVLVPTDRGLTRFSVSREGSFEGRDPWPEGAEPGNVLPVGQVLLVSDRDAVQAFYTWEQVEQDVAARRRARPDDPLVLLEAGEIYRVGGSTERARAAFHEAMRIAGDDPAQAAAVRRAREGLHLTWMEAAKREAAARPEAAARALREALRWATAPRERVAARIRLDALLGPSSDERVKNLERLAAEAGDVRARFPGQRDEVPVRAAARLRLARLHVDRDEPEAAIRVLQTLLAEDGDAPLAGTSAHRRAEEQIDEILARWGRPVYAPQEARARALLEAPGATEDAPELDRILREYPNATVVPEVLFALAKQRFDTGRMEEAATALGRLLREFPRARRAPAAAAWLARTWEDRGLAGAAAFARAWLGHHHPDATIEIDGRSVRGRAFAERGTSPALGPPLPPLRPFVTPLREVRFVTASEGAWGAEVKVSTANEARAPVALFRDGGHLVGFDLPGARVAFTLDRGPCHRAHYDGGRLLLAVPGRVLAVGSLDGAPLWEREVEGTVIEVAGTRGLFFVLVQDTRGNSGNRRLLGLDAVTGREIWRTDLGRADFRDLFTHGVDLLLRQWRYERNTVWPAVLVFDGLTGRKSRVLELPGHSRMDEGPMLAGGRLVYAARDAERNLDLVARRLDDGTVAWKAPLEGSARVGALLHRGEDIVVLREDGTLVTYAGADGTPRSITRIQPGEGARATPYHYTRAALAGEYLVLMPLVREPPYAIGAWDLGTGKLGWLTPWPDEGRPARAEVAIDDGVVIGMVAYNRTQAPARLVIRILDAGTGEVKQTVEPVGLAPEHGFLSLAHGWGTLLVFGRSGAILYGPAPKDDPARR
ncbi:MAG: PQQ-binding-like beta-propeller repeat protein, partial [Planctomycetota bacterium]